MGIEYIKGQSRVYKIIEGIEESTDDIREGWTPPPRYHGQIIDSLDLTVKEFTSLTKDTTEQNMCTAEIFSDSVYLHCCDFSYTFSFIVPSLPFLNIEGLFAHFSLSNSPSKRGMCILPLSRELLKMLDGCKSPLVVELEVKSTVLFKVSIFILTLNAQASNLMIFSVTTDES